ncbi:MAG: hypothetical protein KGQ59_12290, partial [Bdellovibrionales bacterium]|nr:hypothetical protein [Bdellovibrionales bacterium]
LESILLAATLLAWIDRRWLLAGALIGSAFFVRFQTGLHYLSLSLTLLLIPGLKSKDWIRLTLGYGAVIFVGALTETWMTQKTGSAFLSPFINYVRYNVVEGGAARDYGSDPWHRYISEWIKFWGWLGAPALLVCGFRLLTENFNLPLKKATLLLALMPIIAHSMIAHKEGRFLVGSIWLVIPIAAAGFASIRAPKVRWIIGAIFIFAALISGSRVQRRWMHHASDVRELSTLGKSISPTVTTIQISADPNLDPVGFYLRTRAHFCHPDTVNSCAGMPKIRIGTRGWELVP